MERASILFLSLSTAMLNSAALRAQRPELDTQADVEQHVMNALTADKAHGKLAELATALGLRGEFAFDMTVERHGEVETLFPTRSTIANIPFRNALKDYLKNLRFEFKLKKGQRYKLHETLDFP